jgi:negative regulator of flagellin synthesis FlgM
MKINDVNRAGMVNPYRNQMSSTHVNQLGKKEKSRDNVEFSNEARRLLEAAGDPERAAKIERLKESVQTGTYYVDAGKIAEKLLPYLTGNK